MIETVGPDIHPADAVPVVQERPERRWSASMALLAIWWLPATTARRTQHISLARAWAVHFWAAVLGFLLILVLAAWANVRPESGRDFLTNLGHVFDWTVGVYLREIHRWPLQVIGATVGVVLLIESGFVTLALLVAPWGAADERLRSSMAHALRMTWLHTAAVLPAILLVGCIVVPLDHASQAWSRQANVVQPAMPLPPDPPQAVAINSPEWQEYQKQLAEYNAKFMQYQLDMSALWEEQYARRPWYIRYDDEIVGLVCVGTGIWLLWALLRAVGIKRPVVPIARPPICETCGYNLTSMPLESRCPECGEPVMNSLGPMVRRGMIWERRREVGRLAAWWRTSVYAAKWAEWTGRQLRACTRVVDHRSFCIINAALLAGVWYITILGILGVQPRVRRSEWVEVIYFIGPIGGLVTAACGVAVALVTAGLIGVLVSVGHRRNLVPVAMQMASYLMGFLVLCASISALLGVTMVKAEQGHWFREVQRLTNIDHEVFAFFTWLLPTVGMGLLYLFLVHKGMKGARFANS